MPTTTALNDVGDGLDRDRSEATTRRVHGLRQAGSSGQWSSTVTAPAWTDDPVTVLDERNDDPATHGRTAGPR